MKTSNKILLATFGIILAITLIIALIIKLQIWDTIILGDNSPIEVARTVEPFTKIEVSHNVLVNFTQTPNVSVVVKTDSNVQEKVTLEVIDSTLHIGVRTAIITKAPIEVSITNPTLTNLRLDNGAIFKTLDSVILKTLTIQTTEGADLFLRTRLNTLRVETSNGCIANVEGKCTNLFVNASNGSNFYADSLLVQNCYSVVSNGARQNLHIRKTFEADVTNGGTIYYRGNPTMDKIETSNGGNLIKK